MDNSPSSLVPNSTNEDSVVWVLNAQGFSIKSAWEAIRLTKPVAFWWKVVWFKFHIPKWAIVDPMMSLLFLHSGRVVRRCGYSKGLISLDQEVWLERNARTFKRMQRDVHFVLAAVLADLRSYLSSWRKVKRSVKNQKAVFLVELVP
ncbi:hypothetical protein RHSIM_Rhsim11G0029500 [Rhododendron simsii]|uniref:Uncharacterized protein n=1 Tax=Rhododendron simsii TaxID=118357 RepID=A0A834LAR4_RHOSS|nr:hypothetical protein RHSIM_Rhsim11G0029500 [Rhododendron simsii]